MTIDQAEMLCEHQNVVGGKCTQKLQNLKIQKKSSNDFFICLMIEIIKF